MSAIRTDDFAGCVSYRLVLLASHVSSEDRLHGQSGSLLLPVALPLHVHPAVLLDDDGRPSATQELGKAEDNKYTEQLECIVL